MKAIDRPFTNIINGTSQFVIPVFQRDYTWQADPHCAQLWRDVLRAARTGREGGHFLGSIVYIATGDSLAGFTRWLLIDGQQRLTTLTLLLTALRNHLERNANDSLNDEENYLPTPAALDDYFLHNRHGKADRKYKLCLRRSDQQTLAALVDEKEMPAPCAERISENFRFFAERISEANLETVHAGIS